MPNDRANMNSGMSSLPNQTEQNPSSAVAALSLAKDGFEKASRDLIRAIDALGVYANKIEQVEGKQTQDAATTLNKLEGIGDKHLSKAQAIGSALLNTFSSVATFAVKQFTDASDRIISSYNQNLEAITVRQQWANQTYTKELREATDWIRNEGLVKQFSQIDWSASLSEALSTGLRDEIAERVAERNLIANKLLPQLQTNSRTYTRANKLLGESLNQNVIAIGKYTEKIYGAEGLEEGQINNFMDTLLNEVMYAGTRQGLSRDQVGAQVGNMLGSYQQYANQYGSQYAEEMLGALKGISEGDVSNVMALASLQGTGIKLGNAGSLSAEGVAQFMRNYTNEYAKYAANGPGMMANMAGYGGSSYSYMAVANAQYYGQKYQDWLSQGVNAQAEYQNQLGALRSGQYTTAQTRLDKTMENAVADVSSVIAQYIPENAIGLIGKTVSEWFHAWVAFNTINTSTNIAGSVLGKGGATLLGKQGLISAGVNSIGSGLMDVGLAAGYSNVGTELGAIGAGLGTTLGAATVIGGGAALGLSGAKGAIGDFSSGNYLRGGINVAQGAAGLGAAGVAIGSGVGAIAGGAGLAGGIAAAATNPVGWGLLVVAGLALTAKGIYDVANKFGGIDDSLKEQQADFNAMLAASGKSLKEQQEISATYTTLNEKLKQDWEDELKNERKNVKADANKLFDDLGVANGSAASLESLAGQNIYRDLLTRADAISDENKKQAYLDAVSTAFKSHGGISQSEYEAIVGGSKASTGAWFRTIFSRKLDDKSSWLKSIGVDSVEQYKAITGSNNANLLTADEIAERAMRGYATGTDYVTGNQMARIHRGEAVLTASAADKLRKLANGTSGLSGFIDALWDLGNYTSAAPEETEISFDPVVDAINNQTEELKDSLSQIALLVKSLTDPSVNAKVDRKLVTFQGAGGS